MDRVTLLVANGRDSESEPCNDEKWRDGLNDPKIRGAFAKVDVFGLSLPAKSSCWGRSRIPVGVDYVDGRDLLQSGRAIPFPHGNCHVVMNPLHEAFFVQLRVSNPSAQLSFYDAKSLLDLLPYSSRAIWVRRCSPSAWNIYFTQAEATMRFVDSPPPFVKDFPNVSVDVRYDMPLLSRYAMKAAWLLRVFPVMYDWAKKPYVLPLAFGEVKAKVWEKFGSRLHHLVHPYPRSRPRSGVMFFRDPKDAVEFTRGDYREANIRLFPADCRLNNHYRLFKGF